jgi:hypothetical protein
MRERAARRKSPACDAEAWGRRRGGKASWSPAGGAQRNGARRGARGTKRKRCRPASSTRSGEGSTSCPSKLNSLAGETGGRGVCGLGWLSPSVIFGGSCGLWGGLVMNFIMKLLVWRLGCGRLFRVVLASVVFVHCMSAHSAHYVGVEVRVMCSTQQPCCLCIPHFDGLADCRSASVSISYGGFTGILEAKQENSLCRS